MTIAFASFVVLLTTLGILYYEGSKKTVAITLNDQQKVVKTHADTIKELLDEIDVSTRSQDYLQPKANTKVKDHLKDRLEASKTGSHCQGQREENDLDDSRNSC